MATLFIILIFLSYITLGLPDSASGTAWPYMRAELGMPLAAAGIFTMIVTICSAISSLAAPRLSKRTGTGPILAVCSLITGASILGISFSSNYYIILALAVPLGIAGGGVDVSINNYVSERYSSSVMNWVHASWGLGAMIGPLLITLALNRAGTWRTGFQILAGIQLAFAVILFITLPMWKKEYAKKIDTSEVVFATSSDSTKRRLAIALAIATFFLYCGAEVGVGNWLNSLLVESRGFNATMGGTCVSLYYGTIMAGRLVTGVFSNKLGARLCIRAGCLLALTGTGIFFVNSVAATYVAVAFIGLGFAPVYPCLMHETVKRFSSDTAKKVVGYQVAAACIGVLSLSPLVGLILQNTGLESLPLTIMIILILLILSVAALDLLTPYRKEKADIV